MATSVIADDHTASGSPRTGWASPQIWLLCGLLLAAVAGFMVGSHRSLGVTELSGRAYVGDHVATIQVGDRSYGFSRSVAWLDESGSYHEDGWPTCLGGTGNTTVVRFGALAVTLPNGSTIRPIIYVDCRRP